MKKFIPHALIIVTSLWVQPAMAYIDPGSGSAIMSAVIGFFVAISLVIKTYWYKFRSFFTKKKNTQATTNDNESRGEK